MRVGPADESRHLLGRIAIPSDPHACPRTHWSCGNGIVATENSAVIRFTIDDHLDSTWFQTLLGSPHGDECRQATRLGGAKQPSRGGRLVRTSYGLGHVGMDRHALWPVDRDG